MSEVSEAILRKCFAFSDRIIKLNDHLLKQGAEAKLAFKVVMGKRVYEKSISVYLKFVATFVTSYSESIQTLEPIIRKHQVQ